MRIISRPKKISYENHCSDCDNHGVRKTSYFYSGQANHADVKAACTLLRIRRSKSETDIRDAKLNKLRWICSKLERQRKTMKVVVTKQSHNYHGIMSPILEPPMLVSGGQSVDQCLPSSGNVKVNVGSEKVAPQLLAGVRSVIVKMFRCNQCNQVFNSGQALGGHKRAHYKGPLMCRSGSNQKSQATA